MSKVIDVNSEQFLNEVDQHKGRVLVDFYAPWCAPCKAITPIIEQIATECTDIKVVKVNADNAQDLMVRFGVRGIPTLLLIENGDIIDTKVGMASLAQIKDFID